MIRLIAMLIGFAVAATAVAFPPLPQPTPEPKKDAPKSDPAPKDEGEVDVQKTAERIAENCAKSGRSPEGERPRRRNTQDPGRDRQGHRFAHQESPATAPPPMSSDMNPMMPPPKSDMPPPKGGNMGGGMPMPMPMGGMSGGGSPKPGGGSSGRRPRPERKPRGGSPMGMNEPMPMGGGKEPMPAKLEPKEGPMGGNMPEGQGDRFGKASPKRENDKLADLYKDVWGHLPERLRQEMDLYYREQFMPRYSELLRRYYAALAEQKKKGSEDR